MVRGGVDLTQTSVNEKGETITKTIRTYGGRELGMGAYGVVVEVSYVEKGSTQLKSGVMKNPHNTDIARENFAHEGSAAKTILDLQTQYPELRAQHLIKPIFVSDKAIVYEKAMDKNGKTSNLEKEVVSMSSKDWLLQFAGGVEGLAYMQAHGISHNDFKPGNIVVGAEGGILIDVGSKVSVSDINSGKVQIRTHSTFGIQLPHYVTKGKNGGEKADWVGQDPTYNNGHLLVESVNGRLPLDVGDKYAVGRSLQFFLVSKGMTDTNGNLAPNAPPEARYLQHLSNGLVGSHMHPYEYIGNNPANGRDPGYIPLNQVNAWISQTALTFP
jgi:serine/threonine protein kinase